MSNPNQNKPGGKPGQQNRSPDQARSPKPEQQRAPKPDQQRSPEPGQQPDGKKQFDAALASANALQVDLQTIATAYSDYTRKSFEQTKTFVEKLSAVRSLDKAIEIQTEFAKQAYESFMAESQKIRELYSGLAKQTMKQTFKPFEGLVAKPIPATH
jgi:Phasin protein